MTQQILQEKLEFLSQKQIRKGFQKFIFPTFSFLKISDFENLSESDSKKIIQFINSSNSKCSLSYWILRKGITEEEARSKLIEYNRDFVNASYKFTTRSEVASRHTSKNVSRGYSGYVEIDGIEKYCRSSNEFILWHILAESYGIKNIKYEHCVFNINDLFNYKPDYFVYQDSKLIKIVEAKDPNFLEGERFELIRNFFKKMEIKYEIITNCKEVVSKELKIKLEIWKNSDRVVGGNKGKLNPRFGAIVSDETKRRISEKGKERGKDPEYCERLSNIHKQRYIDNPELREIDSIRAQLREQNMTKESKILRIENYKNTIQLKHYHDVKCVGNCGQMLHLRKNKESICKECKRKRTKSGIKEKMGKTSIEFFFIDWINDCGLESVISIIGKCSNDELNMILLERKRQIGRINAKVGINSILKYYNSLENLISSLKENNVRKKNRH